MFTKFLDYYLNDLVMEGYIAFDEKIVKGSPLILLIHDWTGNREFVQEKARYFASQGFVAFAVDLYGKGKRGSDDNRKLNEELIGPLLQDRSIIIPRLHVALDCAKAHANIDSKKIILLGFCLGGMCALDFARTGAMISGAVSIHGLLSPPKSVRDEEINAKVLILHGHGDPNVSTDDIQEFASEMNMRKADWQLHIFGNTSHSFTNPNANEPKRGLIYSSVSNFRTWPLVKTFMDELFLCSENVQRIHCQEPWFSKIRAGIKTVEGRKFNPKYSNLKQGDLLEFYCDDDSFLTEVLEVRVYKSLEEYLETEGFQNVLPGVNSFEEAVNVYLQYSSRDELQRAGGFLGIHVKKIFSE